MNEVVKGTCMMHKSKKVLAMVLTIVLCVSLLGTLAMAAPPVVTGKVVVGGEDYRVSADATSVRITLNSSFDTEKWKAFVSGKMWVTATNGVVIDGVTYSRLATGTAIYTADRNILTIDDSAEMQPTYIDLDISNITDTSKVSTLTFERGAAHVFSILPLGATHIGHNQDIDASETELRDIKIIVQQPVTVKVTGAGNGNTVSVPTTNYNYGSLDHATYDSKGAATLMTSAAGTALYVDTGAGMQNAPAFNYTVADGYKLVITDGTQQMADIETSGTYTMPAAVVAAKNIEFKFVKVSTNVTVTVNPTTGGAVKVGSTEAGAAPVADGGSVQFKANTVQKLWILPATGYEIDTVTLDEESITVGADGSFTLSFTEAEAAAKDDYNLVVNFKLKKFSVDAIVAGGTGGSIKVGDTDATPAITGVEYGTNSLSVNIVPDTGYELIKLEIKDNSTDWSETAPASSYDFPAIISENFGIRATFALKTYDVNVEWVGNGKVQYNSADISDNKISGVVHGTSPKFTFVPTDDTYQVDKIEVTTNGDAWSTIPDSRGLTEYTLASVENEVCGIKVTFGPKVNSIAIDTITKADNYDDASNGMIILRGDWMEESTYDLSVKINDVTVTTGVNWSVEGAAEYGFNSNCVSVSPAGKLTVLKSGITRVKATSTLDPTKSCYVVVIVPGDYNRSNSISGTDASTVLQINAEAVELDSRPYSLELADMNRNNSINGSDGSTIRSINAEEIFIVRF